MEETFRNASSSRQNDPKPSSLDFCAFPSDVQACILSILSPADIFSFSCACKRFSTLCSDEAITWRAICHRRWGSKTQIEKWGDGQISYKLLYKTLEKWENLIGFWRIIGQENGPLVMFDWGAFCLTGSRVSSLGCCSYEVRKVPFLWLGLSHDASPLNFFDPEYGHVQDACKPEQELGFSEDGSFKREKAQSFLNSNKNLDPEAIEEVLGLSMINVNFVGNNHIVIERRENYTPFSSAMSIRHSWSPSEEKRVCRSMSSYDISGNNLRDEDTADLSGSLPDNLQSEIYQYFANRTSPVGDRASRRQRRREKERSFGRGQRKSEAEHFVKIVDCYPTRDRPLQGLWKGTSDCAGLNFYLVTYDDIGGIACRRVGSTVQPYCSPVFWTSNSTFLESPLSQEEEGIYIERVHGQTCAHQSHGHSPSFAENEVVSRILYINSSYALVMPDLIDRVAHPRDFEGRVWLYANGTMGFGFLRDNYITQLKHLAFDGLLLDMVEEGS
ncbi:hypothetical protein AMTRI_Chr12g272840 [Amborella trichopoda]|uniref:F-box protein n=1 Tax=Amborella trichopoda TaxID=13333 RepID=U5D8U8_AMBTC|nr:F-box protein At3g12350 [Amborella trichopoda]ERN18630.1 hypothetical protein AMTR_s00065p00168440 [Amborella trichopoda]|eukprot:XP_006857163.1 F-box protein At3g12350 [Amborella trichopoda]